MKSNCACIGGGSTRKTSTEQIAKVIAEFRADMQKGGFEKFVKDFCKNIPENPPR